MPKKKAKKRMPLCKKCETRHWAFQPCPKGKGKKKVGKAAAAYEVKKGKKGVKGKKRGKKKKGAAANVYGYGQY